jgi:hypothetical protein
MQQDRMRNETLCPVCGAPGSVEEYLSYRVHSVLILTSWRTRVHSCCPQCARKAQVRDLLYCACLGWWGVPFGLIITPLQIARNCIALWNLSTSPGPQYQQREQRADRREPPPQQHERPRTWDDWSKDWKDQTTQRGWEQEQQRRNQREARAQQEREQRERN